ncbi:MAG: tetratricopeptide repeat protein [Spirochaetes bacterium]|nr:tetratricopeptide repeat protein [Spirochaetota bacterium]
MKRESGTFPHRESLSREYRSRLELFEGILKRLVEDVRGALTERELNATIKYRVKGFDSYFGKLIRRMRDPVCPNPREITDILGIRIVCPFLEDIEKAEGIVRGAFDVAKTDRKGIQHSFKEFGYEAVHLMIRVGSYLPRGGAGDFCGLCEVQLCTTLQDAWSEVEHELVYKTGFTPFDIPLKRKLAALNANLTLSDIIFQEIRDYHRDLRSQMSARRDALYDTIAVPGHSSPEGDSAPGAGITARGRERGIESMPEDSIDNILLKAITAHNIGRYDCAVDLYNRLLELGSLPRETMSVLYNHRGMARLAEMKYREAAGDFTSAVEADPANYRALNNRGICYRMTGDLERALGDLNSSLELHPYHADSYYGRALVYYDLGDLARSLEDCERAVNFKPESPAFRAFADFVRKKMFSP